MTTAVGSLGRVSGSAVRLPTSVFVVAALVLVALGAIWWTRSEPSAAVARSVPVDSARAPAGSIVVLRLDDGKVLKYESGGGPPPTSWHRRCRSGLPVVPSLRSVGQDDAATAGC
jgi:hypothetical protein